MSIRFTYFFSTSVFRDGYGNAILLTWPLAFGIELFELTVFGSPYHRLCFTGQVGKEAWTWLDGRSSGSGVVGEA